MYNGGKNCGRSILITRTDTGKQVTAVVADMCPTCDNDTSLDLSLGAFNAIASESEGLVRFRSSRLPRTRTDDEILDQHLVAVRISSSPYHLPSFPSTIHHLITRTQERRHTELCSHRPLLILPFSVLLILPFSVLPVSLYFFPLFWLLLYPGFLPRARR